MPTDVDKVASTTVWAGESSVRKSMRQLATRIFRMADQERFAAICGDRNPLHMDVKAARKTQAGAPALHGVNGLLWALDRLFAETRRPIAQVTARFEKFMTIDAPLDLLVAETSSGAKLEIRAGGGRAAAITVKFGPGSEKPSSPAWPPSPLPDQPDQRSFAEVIAIKGAFPIAKTDPAASYPDLTSAWGAQRICGLAAMSTLVGMVAPGLYSILSSITLSVVEADPDEAEQLTYQAVANHEAFHLVTFEVAAPGLRAEVDAFMRPPPVVQPAFATLCAITPQAAFEATRAVIIGGSRGLGETTAKILAAGGAQVCISYATGKEDAARVRDQLAEGGIDCPIFQFDATLPVDGQLSKLPFVPNQLYYFATSKIFRQKSSLYAPQLFDEFHRVYATAFYDICKYFSGSQPISVFYPSSVAVETRPRDMTEYAMAKAAAEVLCDDIDKFLPGIRIVRRRLPRLATDQTSTLAQIETESVVDVMSEIIGAMATKAP